ncbi:winged helix-turn-helix transcriptional regulator [Chryseobacterium mulctrae]|uniref:winged helix-turn-helix transcriptional regulator n=1 Tax=Chryseobacterium mulctrae TaxID=2576777 RepID=UPI0011165674|nr:helix-turn-helix domain-containing protein [Chryseobacterium mulctrae]
MTTKHTNDNLQICPLQRLLKLFSGKLKPEIFLLATKSSLRFNTLLREIRGANKQSLAIALKDLTEADILERVVIKNKPLHIEYHLTEKGKSMIPLFEKMEELL